MANLKVGDRFRVRTDLIGGNIYGGLYFSKNMEKFRGNILTVKRVNTLGRYQTVESGIYVFNSSMIEAIDRNQSIHITTDGNKVTTAIYKQGKQVVKRAQARCNDTDEFDFNVGAKLAMERLMGTSFNKSEDKYREVKRSANVGDLIKSISDSWFGLYKKGDIFKVSYISGNCRYVDFENDKKYQGSSILGKVFIPDWSYVVLENKQEKTYTQLGVDGLLKAERNRIYEEVSRVFKGVGINGSEI